MVEITQGTDNVEGVGGGAVRFVILLISHQVVVTALFESGCQIFAVLIFM